MIALVLSGHYAHGEMSTQAMAQSSPDEQRSEHHQDLNNRADMLGIEQDFFRGATNFTDPGYRDMPNPAQMQLQRPAENDHQRSASTHP
jgi:hypothetical protein